jgi:hypothetical protein
MYCKSPPSRQPLTLSGLCPLGRSLYICRPLSTILMFSCPVYAVLLSTILSSSPVICRTLVRCFAVLLSNSTPSSRSHILLSFCSIFFWPLFLVSCHHPVHYYASFLSDIFLSTCLVFCNSLIHFSGVVLSDISPPLVE